MLLRHKPSHFFPTSGIPLMFGIVLWSSFQLASTAVVESSARFDDSVAVDDNDDNNKAIDFAALAAFSSSRNLVDGSSSSSSGTFFDEDSTPFDFTFAKDDDDDPECDDKTSSRYDPMTCWLWKLKVDVEDQKFKKSLVTVKVTELRCSNFKVESIDSKYVPSNHNNDQGQTTTTTTTTTNPSIGLAVKGISATCTGKYHASGGASGNLSLKAKGEKDDQPALQMTFDFVSSNTSIATTSSSSTSSYYWMPSALNTTHCEADLKIDKMHCSGSASGQIVNLFSRLIKGAVSSELNKILCPLIKDAVDPFATESITSVVKTLTKYLQPPPPKHKPKNDQSSALHREENDNNLQRLLSTPTTVGRRTALAYQQSTAHPTIDFEKDTPLLVKSLKTINHLLDCFYNDDDDVSTTSNTLLFENNRAAAATALSSSSRGRKCTNLFTKGLMALMSTALDSLAEEIHVPIPKFLHKVEFKLPLYGRILVDVQNLHIRGLDGLNSLSILSPILQQQRRHHRMNSQSSSSVLSDFQTRLRTGTNGLNVTADVNITVFPIPGGIIHGDPLHEAFHVHLNVSTMDVLGVVGLALKSDPFKHIQIGTILDSLPARFHPGHIDPHNSTVDRKCLLDSLQTLQVKDMEVQALVQSVTLVPRFSNVSNAARRRRRLSILSEKLERDLDEVINHGLELVLREYQPLLTDAAAGFASTALVSIANRWIQRKVFNTSTTRTTTVDDAFFTPSFDKTMTNDMVLVPVMDDNRDNNVCSSGDDGTEPQLVNFTTLGYLKKLNQYINKPSSLESINNALDKLAAKAHRHHDVAFGRSLLAMTTGLENIPGVSIKLRDLQIDNAGRIQHIDLLSPEQDGLRLKNGFSMADSGAHNSDDLPTIHVSIGIGYRPRGLDATLNLTVSLGDIFLDGGQILRFDMARLRRLSLIELLSHGHCVIVPFKGHRIYNNHNVSRIGTLFANATVSVVGDEHFENFTTFMDTVTYPSAASLIMSIVGWTLDTLQMTANSFARSSFNQAEGYCTGGKKFGGDDNPPKLNDHYVDHWFLPVLYIAGGLFVAAQLVFLFGHHFYGKQVEGRASSDDALGSEPFLPYENGEYETYLDDEDKEREISPSETLIESTAISAFSRQAVPIFIVGTIVLLVSSNISSGATVDLELSWNESQTIKLPAIFTFSLLNTARDMWQAKIYPLFFMVLIMSGIWPYTKLLLMLGSWIAPIRVLSPRTRERLLLALDALGKFALIDFLLFVLMMVAFRYHLDVTDKILVDVFVSPETGFYSFLAATCFSLVIGHFMVFCHRCSEMRHLAPRNYASTAQFKESVFGHKYVVGYSNEGAQRLRLSRPFRGMLIFFVASAVVLLSVGITQKSFKFEIGGLAGDLLGEKRTTYYSLWSLGSSLRRSVKDPSSVGIIVLEIIFYFYAVVTPFACLGILFILLLWPMKLSSQRLLLALAEIANAWSAIEVFVIAIVASLLEISTFASFIVGHRCDLIKKILKEYFESAISDESDATCFTVRSSVEQTAWVLVTGVLVNSAIVSILLRFVHCSVAERIEAEMESSLVQRSEDALDPEESHRPRTIAGLLFCGCFRGRIFENGATTALRQRYGYVPQSTDTYSVAEVNWDEATHFTGPTSPFEGPSQQPSLDSPATPFDGPIEEERSGPSESVLETIRNAFD